ncbi:MAG: hypothetical protein MUF34_23115 [Polyangiaceae bacterium]|nr:hypothetical protein [Polyangiaceae bacterium]
MRLALALAFSACFTLAASASSTIALGAEPGAVERALRLSDEGVELYKAHDYRRAIEKYASAYEFDPDPNLLYNQGKCYEALGDYPGAKEKYNEFLSKPNGDVNARKKAGDFVAKFNAGSYDQPLRSPIRLTLAAQLEPPVSWPGPAPASTGGASALRPIGYSLLTVGLLGAGVGAYFFFKGSSSLDDVKDAPGYGQAGDPGAVAPMTEVEARKKIDDGTAQRTLGVVVMAAGAGLAAVGALFVLAAPSSARARGPALSVSPLPGGGYALFGAKF